MKAEMRRMQYQSPYSGRYGSAPMRYLWSDEFKMLHWRRCWILWADALDEAGFPGRDRDARAQRQNWRHIEWDRLEELEVERRHDVAAAVEGFREILPPGAASRVHIGMTSAFVTDNTDLVRMAIAAARIREALVSLELRMAAEADFRADEVVVGRTHGQIAAPTTRGRRIAGALEALDEARLRLEFEQSRLRALGPRGATGSSATALQLLRGDPRQVERVDEDFARRLGFEASFPVSSQTYPRRVDRSMLAALAGIATAADRMAGDLRLLAALDELEAPFDLEGGQVGSSAMPYKRNPIGAERIGALARKVRAMAGAAGETEAGQWLERSLDDSAIRRSDLPEAFLAVEEILQRLGAGLGPKKDWGQEPKPPAGTFPDELLSEALLLEAIRQGIPREEAYRVLQKAAHEARASGRAFLRVLLDSELEKVVKEVLEDRGFGNSLGSLGEVRAMVGEGMNGYWTRLYLGEKLPELQEAESLNARDFWLVLHPVLWARCWEDLEGADFDEWDRAVRALVLAGTGWDWREE